jgi:oligopeptide/dipeptide ABC transporter ATP-binding protein
MRGAAAGRCDPIGPAGRLRAALDVVTAPLIQAQGLARTFTLSRGTLRRPALLRAVDGVDLDVRAGETLALVGESGCGKSTLGQLLIRLIEPSAGRLLFQGTDLLALDAPQLRAARRRMAIVFQDPYGSLDPRMTAAQLVTEPLRIQGGHSRSVLRDAARRLLAEVGMPVAYADRYPHQFSGGQRQRLSIARALALRPAFIVCDEPVSALDVSVQAQIVNLLQDLQQAHGLTYLFVSHDLSVVRHIADRVAVMYLGRIVELAPKAALFRDPLHPYARALIAAMPAPRPGAGVPPPPLEGEVPSPLSPPSGCRFRTRCPIAVARCANEAPALREAAPQHHVACHFAGAGSQA